MASVILKNVGKVYPATGKLPEFPAVKALSLEVRDGEFMVLVGPSGCGKTTTLRMIAGLESISTGICEIGGHPVNEVPPRDRDIAMVFQNYALYPHMTVFQNLAFGLSVQKFSADQIRERVREAAILLGIETLLDRKPKALSGGQRQRVALGRALVRQPGVFLFDEPLSNLDAKMRVQMRAELARLHRELKTTMIYVTHDQAEAMTLGNRICVMNEGRIQQVDTPMRVYNHPANAFVAGFIGSPPMNLIRGSFGKDTNGAIFRADAETPGRPFEVELPPGIAAAANPQGDKPLLLGLRPEALYDRAPEKGEGRLTARVEVVEPLGAETLLYLDSGGKATVVARVSPDTPRLAGSRVSFAFSTDSLVLYDAESGVPLFSAE